MTEQRYKAVLAVIAEGRTVTQVARDWNVSRQTVHVWLERYEADGLEGLANHSHRPAHCPHQMSAAVEAQLLEMRRAKPYWGARRLALELGRKGNLDRLPEAFTRQLYVQKCDAVYQHVFDSYWDDGRSVYDHAA